jgi:hypothetical protein
MLSCDWKFCRRHDCRDDRPIYRLYDRDFTRAFLQNSKKDAFKMLAMRELLFDEGCAENLSRLSDDDVIDQVADLLVFGRLHVHVQTAPVVFVSPGQPQASKAESAPANAPSERKGRVPSSEPSMDSDPPTFPANTDFAAQAATLVAAANSGAATCYI